MTNSELKFLFYALAKRNVGEKRITTNLKEIMSGLEIDHGGNQTNQFKNIIKNIIKHSYLHVEMKADRLTQEQRKALKIEKNEQIEVYGSLLSAKRNTRTNDIIIEFNEDFIILLDDLKYNHTWIYLEQITKLNGKYSIRTYEFLKMLLKNSKEKEYIWYLNSDSSSAPGIRQYLNLQEKYSDWRNLKRVVIEPTFKEINDKCSDISISYEIMKNKYVYALKITIAAKEQRELRHIESDVWKQFSKEVAEFNPFKI